MEEGMGLRDCGEGLSGGILSFFWELGGLMGERGERGGGEWERGTRDIPIIRYPNHEYLYRFEWRLEME